MKALRIASLLVVLSLLLSLVPATPVAVADDPASLLLPVDGSWQDMSSNWYQWVMSNPAATFPLTQESICSVGASASGNTLFVAGGVWTKRQKFACDVPSGKRLFLPVANLMVFPTEPGETPAVIRSQAKAGVDGYYDLRAAVDGIAVQNVQRYRLPSPSTFPLTISPDSYLATEYGYAAGKYTGAATDGYYLYLAPMTPGSHTIYVHGVIPGWKTLDATFRLNVLR
ncbi:MAG: hypothetical protein U0822_00260 [Anaerolineae bacterium]